jgi:DnaJ-class molecular chaperone
MTNRRISPPLIKHPSQTGLMETPTTLCPKCLGVGIVIVMRRSLGPDEVQECGVCGGTGHIHRKTGFYDPVQVMVSRA